MTLGRSRFLYAKAYPPNQAMKSLGNENLSLEEKQGIYISYAHLLGASDEYPSGLKRSYKKAWMKHWLI